MKPSEAAKIILEEMGGDPEEICTGECPEFAKMLVDQCGGEIVSNLSESMIDELEGYNVIEPEAFIPKPSRRNMWSTSHCWVKIDGRFYDAYNPEGVEYEEDLTFFKQI